MVTTCVVCGSHLRDIGAGQYRCPNDGYTYTADLLAEVDAGEWQRIRAEGLACLECDQSLPALPRVYADKQGRAIACPRHGPRHARRGLRWPRWLRLRRHVAG